MEPHHYHRTRHKFILIQLVWCTTLFISEKRCTAFTNHYSNNKSHHEIMKPKRCGDILQHFHNIKENNRNFNASPNDHHDTKVEKKETIPEKKTKCPFSMFFPRYQIQLTRGKEPKDKNRNRINSEPKQKRFMSMSMPFMNNISNNLTKKILMETTYKQDFSNGNFLWMECQDETILNNNAANIHSVAMFWKAVHELQMELTSSYLTAPNSNAKRKIVALPDSSFQTIRGLVEILEWFNEEVNDDSHIIHATIDWEASVPIVVLNPSENDKRKKRNESTNFSLESTFHPEIIQSRIKSWVKRILVDLSICPFTKSVSRSGQGLSDLGVPVAKIYYPTSNSNPTSIPLLMADTWKSILNMMIAGPSGKIGISSILLAAPGFDDYFELWAGPIFCMLEACVSACQGEQQVGLVCFHPQYKTPDGSSWPGFGHMHSVPRLLNWVNEFTEVNVDIKTKTIERDERQWDEEDVSIGGAWQRRTPHAVINVLRADQLEVAEGRRQTGMLYSRNIRVLVDKVGLDRLQKDLEAERLMSN